MAQQNGKLFFPAFHILIFAFILSVAVVLFTGILFLGDGPNAADQPRKLYKTVVFPQGGGSEIFNQPWTLPEPLILDEQHPKGRLLFSNFSYSKGIGNQMFQIASLSALAEENNAQLVVPFSLILRRSFALKGLVFASDEYVDKNLKALKPLEVQNCCRYEKVTPDFNDAGKASVLGYLQSYAYFHPEKARTTKEMFQFNDGVMNLATNFIQSAFIERALKTNDAKMRDDAVPGVDEDIEMAGDPLDSDVFVVGVHVRHGVDIRWNERNRRHGHIEAPMDYYRKAMKEAVKDQDEYLYVICSDDISWAKKQFKEVDFGPIAFCPSRWREVDMAILTRADVLVLSTGTYSWWSGYLGDRAQKVFYYGGWPKKGSVLEKMLDKKKYFLDSWTPL